MHNYYQHRQADRLGDAIATAGTAGVLKQPARAMVIGAFVAGVIETEPATLHKLLASLKTAPAEQQAVLTIAAVLAGRRDLLPRLFEELPAAAPVAERLLSDTGAGHVLGLPVERSPLGLDLQWAYFMATGREEPVLRTILALGGLGDTESLERMMSAHAARWSLASNARLDPRVMEICRRRAAIEPEPIAGILKDIVAAAEIGDQARFRREADAAARTWAARRQEKRN